MSECEIVEKWIQHGRKCKIIKCSSESGTSHYCGYVRVPFKVSYNHLNFLDVHGGITYGVDEKGFIGFDCAHVGDVCIDSEGKKMSSDIKGADSDYYKEWTLEDVKEETNSLAYQVKQVIQFLEALDDGPEMSPET